MKTNLHVSQKETNSGFAVCDENGITVCVTKDKSAAIFFAASTDILAALEACVSQCADYENMTDDCAEAFRNARAAIAKARG